MANSALVLLLLSILLIASAAKSAAPSGSTDTAAINFIKSSCRVTTYPAVCVRSLSPYASTIQRSPRRLIYTTMALCLDGAKSTRTLVYKLTKSKGAKPREMAAMKDCLEQIDDAVDRLGKSRDELEIMAKAQRQEFNWHLSNTQTWMSAALTDLTTCADGFEGKALNGKLKTSISPRVVNVSHLTSNGLSLINKFATRL